MYGAMKGRETCLPCVWESFKQAQVMYRTFSFCLFAVMAALFLLAPARDGEAHPHVYVDVSLTFVVDGTGLAAIREEWRFDDIFSRAILDDIEVDPATISTAEGQAKVKQGAFDYLVNFGYFTFIENKGKRLPVIEVRDFKASLGEGRLAYGFTVPLSLAFAELRDFRVAVFDREYYSDILLLKDGIFLEVNGPAQVSHSVRPARDLTYWQFIVPDAVYLSVTAPSGSEAKPLRVESEHGEVEGPGVLETTMTWVRTTQKLLTSKLSRFGMDIRVNPFGLALWMFLGLSFVYGIVHAVGPGHGKAVVCSYFLSHPGSFFTGALMGNAITFIHMGSAAVVVAVAYLLFSSGMGGVARASLALQPASYGLLALLGVFLLVKALRDLARGGLLAEPSCPVPGKESPSTGNVREVLLVSFVTGLVPCPGAAVILAFSIGQEILWAGLGAIVAMAVGMGVTTTLFAWGAVAARSVTLRLSATNRRIFNGVYGALSICGAAVIALFGTALLLGSSVWH